MKVGKRSFTIGSTLQVFSLIFLVLIQLIFLGFPGYSMENTGLFFREGSEDVQVLTDRELASIVEEEVFPEKRGDFTDLEMLYSGSEKDPFEYILKIMLLAWEEGKGILLSEDFSPLTKWQKACVLAKISSERMSRSQKVSEADLYHYYLVNKHKYVSEDLFFLRHILVHERPGIFRLILKILAGEDFRDLARIYSKDPVTASYNGDLGWLRSVDMPSAFGNAVRKMTPGEIYGPLPSKYGFHLIQLVSEDMGGPVPFCKIRKTVEKDLLMELLKKQFIKLREKYYPRFH